MKNANGSRSFLPALRGYMGDWTYYASLMPLRDVAARVHFASEYQPQSPSLSELLQRVLKSGRAKEIAEYLVHEKQRLFNSLVVAVHGGQPEWHAFDEFRAHGSKQHVEDISSRARESVGFLSFNGNERLFALDGQHRLAGIRLAVENTKERGDEEAAVLFVAHKLTTDGIQRTRRLFTTLNKRAKPVSKGEIIALDEDDAAAICVRRLVEEQPGFQGGRVAARASNNMPHGNRTALTTIGNLYDVLRVIFTRVHSGVRCTPKDITYYRPKQTVLDELYDFAVEFFVEMAKHFAPLKKFFSTKQFSTIVEKNRGPFGGDLLFRPIGLSVLVRTIATLSENYDWQKAVEMTSRLPRDLSKPPLLQIAWDPARHTMKKPENKELMHQMFLYALGEPIDETEVSQGYARAIGQPSSTSRFAVDMPRKHKVRRRGRD